MYRILIVHPEVDVRSAIERALRQKVNHALVIESTATVADGLRRARVYDPHVVFFDVGGNRELTLQAARELRAPGRLTVGLFNPLVARGDWGFTRDFLRAGVGDFVELPPSDDEVAGCVSSMEFRSQQADKEGRVVAFFSQQGGVGTTTLAVNAAYLAASNGLADGVVLCDGAVQFGTVSAYLGLNPIRDMSAFIGDPHGSTAMAACLTDESASGLSVLPAPRNPLDGTSVTPEDMTRVLIELRRRASLVVVDTPPVLDLLTLAMLDSADRIMVVTEAVTPTLLGTAALLTILEAEGLGGDRLSLVLNRFSGFDGNLSERIVRERLGRPITHVVPYDRNFVVAATRGRPIAAGRLAPSIQVPLSSVADDVAGTRRTERGVMR